MALLNIPSPTTYAEPSIGSMDDWGKIPNKDQRQPKILFLSDCYLEGVCWGTFYLSLIRNLAAVSKNLLAIRTNSFFHDASVMPRSPGHFATVVNAISKFKPDIVFSVNHSGLTEAILKVIPAEAKIITLFIDFYGRCPEELRIFSKRDFVWSMGLGEIKENFFLEYKDVLNEEQVEFSLWGADTATFHPLNLKRDIDISFVGSAFNTQPFSQLINSLNSNEKNRQIFIDLYLSHRQKYIFNLVKELAQRGFDFSKVENDFLRIITTNSSLQNIFADQISAEQRMNCLSALQDMNIEIYGEPQSRWINLISGFDARLLTRFKFKAIYDDLELANLYNRSKIGLNVPIDHARENGLSFRVFDIMACRALLMTPESSIYPLESLGFKNGQDFISFAMPEDLRQKCAYFIEHEEERLRITESAYLKLKDAHTLRHRLIKVFSKAGLIDVAESFGNLSDEQVSDQLFKDKVYFLDGFGEDRKIGKDFDPELPLGLINSISKDELAIQFDSFYLRLPMNNLPVWLKHTIKGSLKYTVQSIAWLSEKCGWNMPLKKYSPSESIVQKDN